MGLLRMLEQKSKNQLESLRIEGLGKSFGGLRILKDLSFSVFKGERHAIIGPNGAGKTTLFNMIAGELAPSEGHIYSFDKNITKLPTHRRVREGMVRTFQKNTLLNELTVLDNLLNVLQVKFNVENVWFNARTTKSYPEIFQQAEELLETWGLLERKNMIIDNLSYGEQRQVEILLGIATEPKILLLDEPTAGMSNAETQTILDLLKKLPEDLTLLIIEHDMDVIFELADRVTVLHDGGILVQGDPDIIRSNERVYEVYFGKEVVF